MLRKSIFLFLFIFFFTAGPSHAFWMWTPETNRWINPKYAVKETPQEQLEVVLDAYKQRDYDKAVSESRKLIKHYPRAREAAEAQYYIGRATEDMGNLVKAFKEYQVAVEKYPFSERSGEIVERQYNLGTQMLDGKGKKTIFSAVAGGDYDIVEVFRTVIKNSPYGKYAPAAQYKIGLYLQEKQMYQESRDEFEKTVNDYPESEWAKAAEYQIAVADANRSAGAQYNQKITEAAIDEFKNFAQKYPDAELSTAAQKQIMKLREKEAKNNFLIGHFYEKQKKYKAAKVYYEIIVADYRNTSWATKALERIRDIAKLETEM